MGLDPEEITNSVFLVCCFLVIKGGFTPDQAVTRFEDIVGLPVIRFRDATFKVHDTYALSVLDCLVGMTKAIANGFWDFETFDLEQCERLYDPNVYDISCITPKLIALSSPNSIPENDRVPHKRGQAAYFDVFREMGVTDVVQLNDDDFYDSRDFEMNGFKVHVLHFPDCSVPSISIVESFLDIVDQSKGRVAVHCLAGLGRTGTLIACHMIKHNGFSGAEAIGYLRLARPGSVIDRQQSFLEAVGFAAWRGNVLCFPHSEVSIAPTACNFRAAVTAPASAMAAPASIYTTGNERPVDGKQPASTLASEQHLHPSSWIRKAKAVALPTSKGKRCSVSDGEIDIALSTYPSHSGAAYHRSRAGSFRRFSL